MLEMSVDRHYHGSTGVQWLTVVAVASDNRVMFSCSHIPTAPCRSLLIGHYSVREKYRNYDFNSTE